MVTKIIHIILLALFVLGCSKDEESKVEGDNCFIEHIPDPYDYPVKPGTPEWAKLSNGTEMLSVCQIPVEVLSNISTAGLIETVLNYPLFFEIFSSSSGSIQSPFDYHAEHFNGLQKLIIRNDAAIKLLERYKLMYPGCNENNYSTSYFAGFPLSFAFIEIIITQYEILDQFDQTDLELLFDEVIKKYEEKKLFEHSVMHSQIFSMAIAGRIMYISNYTPFMEEFNNNFYLKSFINGIGIFANDETLKTIYNYSLQFQKK